MKIRDGFIDTVGNTPLIKLRRASEETGCTILGKAEFLNPGGSVKDRAALAIIKDAEERGLLKPGGVIVEGTAGNTGIGLALVGNARGYRTVIVMPETQSQEKKDMLLLCGVDLSGDEYFDGTINPNANHGETWPAAMRLQALLRHLIDERGVSVATLSPTRLELPEYVA